MTALLCFLSGALTGLATYAIAQRRGYARGYAAGYREGARDNAGHAIETTLLAMGMAGVPMDVALGILMYLAEEKAEEEREAGEVEELRRMVEL